MKKLLGAFLIASTTMASIAKEATPKLTLHNKTNEKLQILVWSDKHKSKKLSPGKEMTLAFSHNCARLQIGKDNDKKGHSYTLSKQPRYISAQTFNAHIKQKPKGKNTDVVSDTLQISYTGYMDATEMHKAQGCNPKSLK